MKVAPIKPIIKFSDLQNWSAELAALAEKNAALKKILLDEKNDAFYTLLKTDKAVTTELLQNSAALDRIIQTPDNIQVVVNLARNEVTRKKLFDGPPFQQSPPCQATGAPC